MFPLEIDEFQSPTVNFKLRVTQRSRKQSIGDLVRINIVGTITLCRKNGS